MGAILRSAQLRLEDGTHAVRALPWIVVDEIAADFEVLNPYDARYAGGSILQLEAENEPELADADPQLYVFILGAKRYAMFNLGAMAV